jgi:hypothetical protein
MKKWKVQIPPPSAKRLSNRKIVVHVSDGWTSGPHKEHTLEEGVIEYEFTTDDEREWIGETATMDGPIFDVFVESANSTGSRKEISQLKPVLTSVEG